MRPDCGSIISGSRTVPASPLLSQEPGQELATQVDEAPRRHGAARKPRRHPLKLRLAYPQEVRLLQRPSESCFSESQTGRRWTLLPSNPERLAELKAELQEKLLQNTDLCSALGRTRTCDLLIRSQTLYPAELRAHRRCT
jgi:hypothetical protein